MYAVLSWNSTILFLKRIFGRKTSSEKAEEFVDDFGYDEDENEKSVAVGTEIVPEEWIIETPVSAGIYDEEENGVADQNHGK